MVPSYRFSQWAAGPEALVQAHRWTPGEILAFQRRRLRALASHAYRRVPYYRRLFDQAGLLPHQIRTMADLSRIPITSRADLQRLPVHEVLSDGLDPAALVLHSTSGTSGEPLKIYRTRFEEYLLRAFRLREQLASGARLTDLRAIVGMVDKPRHLERAPGGSPFYARLGLLRQTRINCLLPSQEIIAQLRQLEPDTLAGAGSGIARVACMVTPEDRQHIRPRRVETGGDTLGDEMRSQITRAFGVQVLDTYGSHEFNVLATECPLGGLYHVLEWNLILEVLRDGRPAREGEEGEVVATGLHSFAMPFIRYRLNDLVTVGEAACPCGASVRTLRRIVGRSLELFKLPHGKSLHPYSLVGPLIAETPWLRRYQLVQDRLDHVLVRIVPEGSPGPDQVSAVARRLAAAMDNQVCVDVELVADIAPEPTGKYRPYHSSVPEP